MAIAMSPTVRSILLPTGRRSAGKFRAKELSPWTLMPPKNSDKMTGNVSKAVAPRAPSRPSATSAPTVPDQSLQSRHRKAHHLVISRSIVRRRQILLWRTRPRRNTPRARLLNVDQLKPSALLVNLPPFANVFRFNIQPNIPTSFKGERSFRRSNMVLPDKNVRLLHLYYEFKTKGSQGRAHKQSPFRQHPQRQQETRIILHPEHQPT